MMFRSQKFLEERIATQPHVRLTNGKPFGRTTTIVGEYSREDIPVVFLC